MPDQPQEDTNPIKTRTRLRIKGLCLAGPDLVTITLIVVVGALLALGRDGTLTKVLLGIAIAYGAILIPRPYNRRQ